MLSSEVRSTIKEFILDRFMIGRSPEFLKDSESMLEKGVIDSTGMLELVGFIEERFGITLEDEELTPEYLESVDNIVRFVVRKSGVAA